MGEMRGKKLGKWAFARRSVALALIAVLTAGGITLGQSEPASAEPEIRLTVDGRVITQPPAPFLQNNRTLVPVRVISEDLGATVTWDNDQRTVTVVKGDRTVLLRIDRQLIEYQIAGQKSYQLSDVAPRIYGDRTFVPIRLISNALGVGIQWDQDTRTVAINSQGTGTIVPFYDMQILSPATITGTTTLQADLPDPIPAGAAQIRFLLLSPATGKGTIIAQGTVAQGNLLDGSYPWQPSTRDNGDRILVAALYDANGALLAGAAEAIQVNLTPAVSLTGITPGETLTGAVKLSSTTNFFAAYVKYQIQRPGATEPTLSGEQDPLATYTFTPTMEHNGMITITAIAYDQKDQAYPGQPVQVNVDVPRKFALTGVTAGQTIDKRVTLAASRNFDVLQTEYWVRDAASGAEGLLARVAYASYSWFPGPGLAGNKEVYVKVTATDGTVYTSAPVPVTVAGQPKLLLLGAGPNQVITSGSAVKLSVASNMNLTQVQYLMTNTATGATRILADLALAGQGNFNSPASTPSQTLDYSYTPQAGDSGQWKLQAQARDDQGTLIISDAVTVTVYTGKIYSPKALMEKNAYLDQTKQWAVKDYTTSGMSAALQTAQAILETGWGQSIPVDKYSGKMSFNLFGIKGSASAGSVLSNTWEEYNGVSYRTDAKFRAYGSAQESWADHNRFLLTGARYEPFRKVMYDSSQGAWALKRAGYATDSKYPVKLMRIIENYGLVELDQLGI